jgi:predicted transcriptional regulator
MAQLTLYLDDELETRLRAAARAANLSQSRWVANLIAEKLHNEWPASVAALAGAWSDFPEADELRSGLGEDAARESF